MPQFPVTLNVSHSFLPKIPSVRSSQVMDQFGIGFEQGVHQVAQGVELLLEPCQTVLFTGESGSGKSSLMKETTSQLESQGQRVVSLDELSWKPGCLIDLLPGEVEESQAILALCGLGEAQLVLRTPDELSDGQRARFRLAMAISQRPDWIVADEFTATLDRRLARIIASNLGRLAKKVGVGFLLATTHEDIVEDVNADQHLRCHLGGRVEQRPAPANDCKKKEGSPPSAGSLKPPSPTGRTSLGGIIAATISD